MVLGGSSVADDRLGGDRGSLLVFFDVESRHRLDDRIIIWKRMKRLDQQLPFSRFDMDETDCSKRHPATGIERVDHFVGGDTRLQLILQHPEHLCRKLL